MKLGFVTATLALLAVFAAPGRCQQVGKPAPEIRWLATHHFAAIANQQLSQLRGSAVLLEFFGPT